ncbi:AMP-binding protein [Actinomarinicola tropica]|uniref:AMP-binding protein n=1 Tax=Actinomarinicola tropica TaxID=2789776 RepID=A0A5Q2RAZ8_9ACTN|nr:AMP-binding protein [Actinomarinicola tropica]QGG94039.1 AMP-binding protein [Actinomarinicola tropica]
MSDGDAMADGGVVLGDAAVSRAEVIEASRRAATGLAATGVGPADSIAVLLRNDIPFFTVTLAARTLGAYAVTINWHWRAGEIERVLVDSGAKVLVVHADLLDEAERSSPTGSRCSSRPRRGRSPMRSASIPAGAWWTTATRTGTAGSPASSPGAGAGPERRRA